MQVLPGAGTESEGISVIAGVPGALQKYFVTAHSEAQHTAFTITSLQLHSSKPLSLLQEGAAQAGAGTLSRALADGQAAAIPHVNCSLHRLFSLVRHFTVCIPF